MTSPYRAGVIGTGWIAGRHLMAYRAQPGVEVVAGADVDAVNLDEFTSKWQIPGKYSDWRDLLRMDPPDLLSVCTWEDSHSEIVIAAAQSGVRGIMCEKPMAMDLAQADAMLDACKRNNTVLAVGHMRRYNPHYVEARRLLGAGAIGRVERMWAYVGGWDMFLWGIHYADMLHYLNDDGAVRWVLGQIDWSERGMSYPYSQHYLQRRGSRFVAEDNAVALMEFSNGVQVSWESGSHSPSRWRLSNEMYGGSCEIRIYGTKGEIRVSDADVGYSSTSGEQWSRTCYAGPGSHEEFFNDQFVGEIGDLVECVGSGNEHPVSGQKGRKALELVLAIYESSRRRAMVKLPLDVRDNPLLTMVAEGSLT